MNKTFSTLFIAVFLLAGSRASGQDFGDVSNNYWGGGNYRLLDCSASGGHLTSSPTNPGFVCSSGLITEKKKAPALSYLNDDTTVNPCGTSLSEGYTLESQNVEPEGYDTLRAFIEDCPLYPNSYQALSFILGAASSIEGGPGGWPGFLELLKQVLYNNPDTNWYCQDALDMLTAEQSNEAAKESICQYIVQSGKCPALAGAFEILQNSAANGRHTLWLDSIIHTFKPFDPYMNDSINIDTLAHPFADTAVPTLQQDSLEILLGPQYAGVQQTTPSAMGSQALLSAQLIENPINNDEIDISYEMGRTALVTMELRDVLGRSVPIANAKYQLEQPGDHTATLPAPNLPAGIYYLRITTDVGDAITLKIVKE